ncbi:M10 family metallopeptidase C-terminal domain-containing protein [Afifella sp. JA880]|uniref:M10 family metallopeptidase C-terminal domain-containing protein n=1 Tax=Afifella sp. JA880 TaxID=2975280 RepID=UPI0021BB3E0C|nr:M10 family metallopeptidase C-terminal domain-containing protein [Afifella sp. JA880]MCT8266401.1 M10 family metallopeptidase C-terminal domain-containing protein [Afifella sp. JA880]
MFFSSDEIGFAATAEKAGNGTGGGVASATSTATIIDQLQTSWTHEASPSPISWAGDTITYSILSSASGSGEAAGFQPLSAYKAAMADQAFALWDDVIAPDIVRTASGGGISIGESSTTSGNGTYTSYSFRYDGLGSGHDSFISADVWLNSFWSSLNDDSDIAYGKYGFLTYLHEIGHSLGLSHPGTYDAARGAVTYAGAAEFAEDTRRFTIMSYFDADEDGSGTNHVGADGLMHYAQTPMLYDILAIQDLYGADYSTRAGDTTYGFGASGLGSYDAAFDFTLNSEPIVTIWDGGGIDTLNVSGFADNAVIDLREGAWSSIGGMSNNLAVAYGAEIENAAGGAGDEVINGNGLDNTLFGGGGSDILSGFSGDDLVFGGRGASNDTLYGGDGDDRLFSGGGDDRVDGGAGNDFIGSGIGSDIVNGNAGNDTIFGGAVPGSDRIDGGDGDDVIWGGGGHDSLYGQTGNDEIGAGGGNDIIDGGAGDDTLFGGEGNDTVTVGAGRDLVYGSGGDDVFIFGADGERDVYAAVSGNGHDAIDGFEVGTDVLDVSAYAGSFAELTFADTAAGLVITLAPDASLTLEDVTRDMLSEENFVF